MLLLDTQLLHHEFLLHLPLLEFQGEACCLLLEFRTSALRSLLQPHELLIVLLTQEQFLLFHPLVHRDVVTGFALICIGVEELHCLLVFFTKCLHSVFQLLFKVFCVHLLLVLDCFWVH